jgi:predicted GIY-YIG superfamily endonuclease
MTLALPGDIERHLTEGFDQLHDPAVYCLTLLRPPDVGAAWDRHFETRPDWFEEFSDADRVLYVGAANDLLHRLEDHVDGEVRKAALLRVCDIGALRNVWWFEDADRAFERESGIALTLQQEYPSAYVHQR